MELHLASSFNMDEGNLNINALQPYKQPPPKINTTGKPVTFSTSDCAYTISCKHYLLRKKNLKK